MDYLYTNHDNIEYEDEVANKHCLTNHFDHNQPIFNIFNRYKDIITLVTKGGKSISAQDKISSAYVILKASGAYDRAVKDWDDVTATQKKWYRFKNHFITAYHKLRKQIKVQVKNTINREITALTVNDLQKVANQFDEGQQ